MIDLTLLSHALALAKLRNYARAAEQLHVSQPTLSRHIAALEASLGVRLFDRNRSRVEPTAFGRRLLQRAGVLVSGAVDLEREIKLMQGLEVGELLVGAGVYPAELSLGTALGRLTSKHPGLRIDVTTGDWRFIIQAVLAGHIDLAVVELSVLEHQPRLAKAPLPRHDGVFYCRAGHPLLEDNALTMKRVLEFPFVGPKLAARVGGPMARSVGGGTRDPGTGDYLPSIKVDTVKLATDAVASSNAVSAAPISSIMAEVSAGRLVPLPVSPP